MLNGVIMKPEFKSQLETRAAKEFSKHSKEEMQAEYISGTLYGFGSELACLRCYHEFRGSQNIKFGFSKSYNTWFFSYSVNI